MRLTVRPWCRPQFQVTEEKKNGTKKFLHLSNTLVTVLEEGEGLRSLSRDERKEAKESCDMNPELN